MGPPIWWGTPDDDDYTSFCNRENEIFPHHKEISNTVEPVLDRDSFDTNHDPYYGDHKDPAYELFLSYLREDGKSYVVEMPDVSNGLMTIVKYEKGDVLPQLPEIDILNAASNETEKLMSTPYGNKKLDEEVYARNTTGSPINVKSTEEMAFSCLDESYQKYLEKYILPTGSKISGVDGVVSINSAHFPLKSECKQDVSHLEDDDYMKFLEKVKLENGFMVLEWDKGSSIKYFGSSAPANNAESTLTHEERAPNPPSLTSNKKENKTEITIIQEERASPLPLSIKNENLDHVPYAFPMSEQYKNKLKEAVSKPYDGDEYDRLLKKASERKPKTKEKHLRAGSISYETREKGRSYFDHYPVLASQFEAADRSHGLKLLRGFFFWLQHLCHDGSYPPWLSVHASDTQQLSGDCEFVPPLDASLIRLFDSG